MDIVLGLTVIAFLFLTCGILIEFREKVDKLEEICDNNERGIVDVMEHLLEKERNEKK